MPVKKSEKSEKLPVKKLPVNPPIGPLATLLALKGTRNRGPRPNLGP